MQAQDAIAAVFPDHLAAGAAIERLTAAGVPLQSISIVGKGSHAGGDAASPHGMSDRVTSWSSRGASWGGLPLDGVLLAIPSGGPVVVLGYLAAAVSAVEGAVVVGGLGGLGGLAGIDAPRDSVLRYETAIAASGVLVLAHGKADDLAQVGDVLKPLNPSHLEIHPCGQPSVLSAEAAGRLAGMLV